MLVSNRFFFKGKGQLGFQRMQNHVHLIENCNRVTKRAQHVLQVGRTFSQRRLLIRCSFVELPQYFVQLEKDALDGRGCGAQNRVRVQSVVYQAARGFNEVRFIGILPGNTKE